MLKDLSKRCRNKIQSSIVCHTGYEKGDENRGVWSPFKSEYVNGEEQKECIRN